MDDTSIKQSIIKTFFVFHPILMKLHQVSSKWDEKHKSFNYRPFNGSVVRSGSVKFLLSGS